MLDISDAALVRLEGLLDGAQPEEEQCLRLTEKDEGEFGLALDWPREGDELFFRNERVVIVVEDEIVENIDDAMLDVMDGPEGEHLGFRPLFDDDGAEEGDGADRAT
jgi:Fe-S cluster assembly iron-binding protein IscA